MYAESICAERIELAEKELGFRLEYHSPGDIDEFNARLEDRYADAYALATTAAQGTEDTTRAFQIAINRALCNPSTPRLRDEEVRFIQNERALAMCDCAYFLTRFYWIKPPQGIQRFTFLPGQRVYFDVISELEARRAAIELICSKARQHGVSTETEGIILHRSAMYYGVNAIVASADRGSTAKMSQMTFFGYDRLPWWLRPLSTRRVESDKGLLEFGASESGISFQHGNQKYGIARGDTAGLYHLSECASYQNADELIEASLFRCVHPHPNVFGALESTAEGDVGWWYDTYWSSKARWKHNRARLCPLFLPWFVGTDKYPTPTWIRTHPVPQDWRPEPETRKMIARSKLYVDTAPVLSRVLGANWELPREQAWYWEVNFTEHRDKGKEKLWRQEMPCLTGDTRVSTDLGMVRIDQAASAISTESGKISAWIPKGTKPIWELRTVDGRILRGTADHRIKSGDDWRPLQSLTTEDTVSLLAPRFASRQYTANWSWMPCCQMSVPITVEFARLLGYFMGDGCFHAGTFEIAVDAKDEDVRADVKRLILNVTGKAATEKKRGNMYRVQSSSERWLTVLKGLQCVQPAIHKNLGRSCGWKRKVCVPECIYRSPREVVREFVAAVFECDGHAYRDAARAILFSCHDEFLRDIQQLLLGFGIRARFAKQERKTRAGKLFTGRQLQIPAAFVNQFYEQVGFLGARKQNGGKRRGGIVHSWGICLGMEDQVASVTNTGVMEPVYDISVSGGHNFSANGIAVHNCDDHESFQGSYDSVFGRETIAEVWSERTTQYHVYGIIGQSVEDRLEPDRGELDLTSTIIPVAYHSRKGEVYRWELWPLQWEEPFEELSDIRDDESHMGKLFVWHPPEPGYDYSIGIDTSNGISMDSTVIAVARRGRTPQEQDVQAAEFRSNEVSHVEAFAWGMAIAAYYARYMEDSTRFREPYVAVEQIAAVGDTCQLQMAKMGYGRFHQMIRYDSRPKDMNKKKSRKRGWFTSSWSRPMLTDGFVTLVKNRWYKVNSPYTMREMTQWEVHYTAGGHEKNEHSEGGTDDGIFANAMAGFCPNDTRTMAERSKNQWMGEAGRKLPRLSTEVPGGIIVNPDQSQEFSDDQREVMERWR